ncbi:M3 family oligoendopeptidase [Swaminathania salitolerans]|uniref:Oligoendopeptidase F n=1 Tax=Swaminathania salitolerans TaxID=182838 RepID=A0A511BP91_9PROT|nr:M3 family oligoendopeptidase [Swaminathania salitolerans]GBQ15726.1 oligoendopeptidase F [Swaminathania salitolerans LMG 21291]GEL01464.1 oligoendopeptidase F [Swaminathania salitolerans]
MAQNDLAALPRWDLSDLYDGLEDPAIERDLAQCEEEARAFSGRWKGRLTAASAQDLDASIAGYERIDQRMGRLAAFAQLSFAARTSDAATGRFSQGMTERLTEISSHLLFFTLELNRIGDEDLAARVQDPALSRWAPFLRDLRVWRPYQLSDEVEQVLVEKSVTGRASWNRLFDETMASLTVTLEGEERPLGDALDQLSSPDREKRRLAAGEVSRVLGANQRLLVLITNTLAKDKAIEDGMRGFSRPCSSRNRANMVEDEVVDALVAAVDADYARLAHRYYTLKAGWLGLETLEHWDRNAPLPGDDDRSIPWDEAKSVVRDAYTRFDPRLGALVGAFMDRDWIDVPPVPGKSSGAFAHPVTPDVHPYILLNYHGRTRDVMTLAHELGHGAHQILAAKQGYLQSSTPLTLAETASVFGEMLTFRALLDSETDPARRRTMLAGKVEDMLNTVVRQVAFYQFETKVHDERRHGELSPERLGEIWRDVQTRSLGPAFSFTPDYDIYWSYVPHFIHAPFYVYAYAFGDCLVNALYGVYESGTAGFQDRYIAMLEAGGTKRHAELLEPFGLDATDPGFWRKGLDVISGFIDELEAQDKQDKTA